LSLSSLAMEETLRLTHDAMVKLNHISKVAGPMTKAKQLIDEIQKATASWTNQNDEQHLLSLAVVAAENIRVDRNKASHPGALLNDAGAVEELLTSASRQIPVFWQIPIDQAIAAGFTIT
jgi:hypothetical protein